MRNCEDKNQYDREATTWPAGYEGKLALEEFWLDQLNRLKEYAESQAIKPESLGD